MSVKIKIDLQEHNNRKIRRVLSRFVSL